MKNNSGTTLIEIIIMLAIILLVSMGIVVFLTENNTTAEEIEEKNKIGYSVASNIRKTERGFEFEEIMEDGKHRSYSINFRRNNFILEITVATIEDCEYIILEDEAIIHKPNCIFCLERYKIGELPQPILPAPIQQPEVKNGLEGVW